MPATPLVAAVTGSRGYLGSRICQTLESAGCQVISMARSPGQDRMRAVPYDLGSPVGAEAHDALRSADVLVHAAYDMSLTRQADIWRVNVAGTHRLLEAAREAEVGRLIVLSSMSAFPGTTQLYGRSKLDIEAMTIESGGCAIRPGLVYGKQSGGMAGALRKLSSLPVVPVIAGGAGRLHRPRRRPYGSRCANGLSGHLAVRRDLGRPSGPGYLGGTAQGVRRRRGSQA